MPAEQQLERSVLERKEGEELRAIAQAMSLQTTSRSKKADIIDSILRAAGVEVDAAAAKVNGSADGRRVRKTAVATAEPSLKTEVDIPADAEGHENGTSAKAASNGSVAEH